MKVNNAVNYMNRMNLELGLDIEEVNEYDVLLSWGVSKVNERVLNFLEY